MKKKMKKKMKTTAVMIIPIVFLLYSMIGINQGADVTDTTYSLGNYLFFNEMTSGWKYAIYLANCVGSLLMTVTGGKLILMNAVTRLFVAAMAIAVFFVLRKRVPSLILFIGEILAISMCWCPTVILYNYLTYFFLTIAALLLYSGLQRQKKSLLLLAGILLGLNVFVRISNLTQMSLILVVLYDAWSKRAETRWGIIFWKNTLFCVLGYGIGCVGMLGVMLLVEGSDGYLSMISWLYGMFTSSDSNGGYSMFDMVKSIVGNYVGNVKWLLLMAAGIAAGTAMFLIAKSKMLWIKRILFAGGVGILFLYFYRNGMFTGLYYSVGSIFCINVVFLLIAYIVLLMALFHRTLEQEDKLLALLAFLILLFTPLGSNNHVYTIMNNLFFLAPVTLMLFYKMLTPFLPKEQSFPLAFMSMAFLILFVIQAVMFHSSFVFRDGTNGEKRDTVIAGNSVMSGMITNAAHAQAIEELENYTMQNHLQGRYALFYGNIPGAQYLLKMPCAISSTWPDLDSYSYEQFLEESTVFENAETLPLFVLSPEVAAYVTEDSEGMQYLLIDQHLYEKDQKLDRIRTIILEYNYKEIFGNQEFVLMEGSR